MRMYSFHPPLRTPKTVPEVTYFLVLVCNPDPGVHTYAALGPHPAPIHGFIPPHAASVHVRRPPAQTPAHYGAASCRARHKY
ncbi:hypothetical protein B0H12DRAFT_1094985 [Mycena haematopus]|nr:hypothetical protein B0H12DRAFT_1094985 [Mycena haematopus]